MRVLLTTFTYPPNKDGVSEACGVLANGLAARGHSVTIATAPHTLRDQRQTNPLVREFDIGNNANFRRGIRSERDNYQKFIREHECDVIVFENWDTWSSLLARPLLKEIKAKKVIVSHGFTSHLWNPYPQFAWGLGVWARGLPSAFGLPFNMRCYDHVVFLSHRAAWDRFLDHWVARTTGYRNFSIIPNGAHSAEFAESRVDFRGKHGIGAGPLFLCVANYCDRKNQLLALRSFRESNIEGSTMVFIGSELNEYSREMEKLDQQLRSRFPAGRVMLLEKVPREETCAAYMASDLFILPAKAETQPIVLLEAMASGTPFISTDTGCVRELPGGVVVKSEAELTAKMRELAGSPQIREKLAAQGKEASRTTYDWERVVDRYEELLLGLVGSKKPELMRS